MRRIIVVGSMLLAGALSVSAFSSSSNEEYYGAADISASQATHFENFLCGLGPAGLTTDSRTVVTPSGNANLVCRGDRPNPTGETIVLDPPFCGTQGGLADNNHLVWTKSGQVTLTCHRN